MPGRRVLDDDHRHRRRDDPGHRPDGAVVVAGRERDLAGARPSARPPRACRPSPRAARADDAGAHRPAHALPGDRRPGVEQQALASSAGQHVAARGRTSTSAGATASIRSSASALAASMRGSAIRRGEAPAERVVAVGRRPPVERARRRAPCAAGGSANDVDADVDERGRPVEQASERGHAATSARDQGLGQRGGGAARPASTAPGVAQRALLAAAALRVGVGAARRSTRRAARRRAR